MARGLDALALSLVSIVTPSLAQDYPGRVLLYTATAGYRHDSIPTAVGALTSRASSINVIFEHTEDRTLFNDEYLGRFDAVAFLSTTGEVLDDTGKDAFQRYLDQGGNFVGIHSASDTLVNTTFYANEVGALFDYHADLQDAVVDVVDSSHPSTSMLPARWEVHDEMYNFKSDPRRIGATVVLSADESSYADHGPRQYDHGSPHPTAWFQDRGAGVQVNGTAGRSFYTSLGHLNETWQDELFLAHVLGGITWALQANTTRAFNPSAQVGNNVDMVAHDPETSATTPGSSPSTSPVTQDPVESSSPTNQGILAWFLGLMGLVVLA